MGSKNEQFVIFEMLNYLPFEDDDVTDDVQFIDLYCRVSSFSTALVTDSEISLTCFSVKVSLLSTG